MDTIKFIDSCVGAIARKVQDEFDESKHPRDKGGRFSSKGGEGRGEGGLHHAGEDVEKYGEDLEARHKETVEKQKARRGSSELEEADFEKEAKKEIESGTESGGEDEDDDEQSDDNVNAMQDILRRYESTHVEDLVDYAEEDGYEAELLSDEFMLVRDDDKEYRAHIDKAGDTYYVDRVEEW